MNKPFITFCKISQIIVFFFFANRLEATVFIPYQYNYLFNFGFGLPNLYVMHVKIALYLQSGTFFRCLFQLMNCHPVESIGFFMVLFNMNACVRKGFITHKTWHCELAQHSLWYISAVQKLSAVKVTSAAMARSNTNRNIRIIFQ